MTTVLIHLLVAAGLVGFGHSSRRHIDKYVPASLPEDERRRRERVLVRGSWACQVVGVVFALMVIPTVISG